MDSKSNWIKLKTFVGDIITPGGTSLRAIMGALTIIVGLFNHEIIESCLTTGALLLGSTTFDSAGGI